MIIFDLLKEFEFADIKDSFLNLYGDYEGKEYIKEFEKIYNFYRDNADTKTSQDFLTAKVDITIETDNNEIFHKLVVCNHNDEYSIDCLSWFLTPRLELSDHILKNYSKKDILAHYLYQMGYEELSDVE